MNHLNRLVQAGYGVFITTHAVTARPVIEIEVNGKAKHYVGDTIMHAAKLAYAELLAPEPAKKSDRFKDRYTTAYDYSVAVRWLETRNIRVLANTDMHARKVALEQAGRLFPDLVGKQFSVMVLSKNRVTPDMVNANE